MDILKEALELEPWIVNIRRKIHRRPELDFDLDETVALVENELTAMNIPHRRCAGSGIAAWIDGSRSGPIVLLRADMDGLPIHEETAHPYSSEIPGRMHGCGHDGHIACLLGAARMLARRQENFNGRALLAFQPAEETTGGAQPMIDDDLWGERAPSAALALHVNPDLPAGTIGINRGTAMAASDTFDLTIRGIGCHGAEPHKGIDTIAVACQTVTALQHIVSRRTDPTDSAVVTVGSFHGGTGRNVVAEEVRLEGIIRSVGGELRERIKEQVRTTATAIPKALGASADIQFVRSYPTLENNPQVCAVVEGCAREILGTRNVVPVERPSMGVDDFAYFAQVIPSCYFTLGIRNEAQGITAPLHSPRFDLDESALPLGASILAKAALRLISGRTPGGRPLKKP